MRKISQSDDPIIPKLLDRFHLQSMTVFSRVARSLNLVIPALGVFVASRLWPSLLSLSVTVCLMGLATVNHDSSGRRLTIFLYH